MKKSLVILILMVFSFVGIAKENTAVAEKSYMFRYNYEYPVGEEPSGVLLWYQEVKLYIDGKYVRTFNIGNRFDIPTNAGFSVPVGSSWRLWVVRTEATMDGMGMMLPVDYMSEGVAADQSMEVIEISVWLH